MIAIENVFMVQPRHREEGLRIGAVSQAMHAVVARAMAVVALVVANHRREVADLECFTRHRAFCSFVTSSCPRPAVLSLSYPREVAGDIEKGSRSV